MASGARADSGQSQELYAGLLQGWQRLRFLAHFFTALPGRHQGAGLKARAWTSAHMEGRHRTLWLKPYAARLAPCYHLLMYEFLLKIHLGNKV